MTQKSPTNWSPNPSAEANLIAYSNATTTYNSATTTYSSIITGDQADSEKQPTIWSNL